MNSYYLSINIHPNHMQLSLHCDANQVPEGIEEMSTEDALKILLADFLESGDITWVDPATVGALTSAPILQHGKNYYWFPDYAIRDEVEELLNRETIEFPLAS